MDEMVFGVRRSATGKCWRWRGRPLAFGEAARVGLDELAAGLLVARGGDMQPSITAAIPKLLHPKLGDWLPDPSLFLDMDKLAALLADAVEQGRQIALFADYDVDGATSAAILGRLLRLLGATPRIYIPDRFREGYGPSAPALLALQEEGADFVLLLDCGTQAHEPLAAAAEKGLAVAIVDHHKASTALPEAVAIVNPNRIDEGEAAAYGTLCTAGLSFLVAAALNRELRRRGFFATRAEPRPGDFLDLVALGTVADVVPLRDLNRAYVALGLKRMARRGNPGLAALADVARLDRPPTAADLGFFLAPRINAGGRIGAADLGVRLLSTDDEAEAKALAAELDRLNEERRAIEARITEEALRMVEGAMPGARDGAGEPPTAVVVHDEGWHQGVIGIVAARLKERLHRPAIVLAPGEDGLWKGSGRSIAGVDLGAAILAAREEGLIVAGGGHKMACGVSLRTEQIAPFAAWLQGRLAPLVAAADKGLDLAIDLAVAARAATPELVQQLDTVGPYGEGWPAPRIAIGPVRLVRLDRVGRTEPKQHIRFVAAGADGGRVQGVAFRAAATDLEVMLQGAGTRPILLAGHMERSVWQGRERAELHLEDAAFSDAMMHE